MKTIYKPLSSGVFGFEKDEIAGDTKRATAVELITRQNNTYIHTYKVTTR